jgi:hypothetical protein
MNHWIHGIEIDHKQIEYEILSRIWNMVRVQRFEVISNKFIVNRIRKMFFGGGARRPPPRHTDIKNKIKLRLPEIQLLAVVRTQLQFVQ